MAQTGDLVRRTIVPISVRDRWRTRAMIGPYRPVCRFFDIVNHGPGRILTYRPGLVAAANGNPPCGIGDLKKALEERRVTKLVAYVELDRSGNQFGNIIWRDW